MSSDARLQLDLFADSRDVMLRNDAIEALWRRDARAAAAARSALAEFAPGHDALAALDVLIGALSAAADPPFTGPAEAGTARDHLTNSVAPAAFAVLGADGGAWLTPLWRRLAESAMAVPFSVPAADSHAAPLWLLAGEAAAAAAAVEAIPSWRRIPAPLSWMAQARHALEGLDAVWPLLVELAWLAPRRLAQCARELADPLLDRLLRRFEAECESCADNSGDLLAWFPAWLLNDQPALLSRLLEARPGLDNEPERVFRLMGRLLHLERRGRHAELIESRKRLRNLQPTLYAIYMRTR